MITFTFKGSTEFRDGITWLMRQGKFRSQSEVIREGILSMLEAFQGSPKHLREHLQN